MSFYLISLEFYFRARHGGISHCLGDGETYETTHVPRFTSVAQARKDLSGLQARTRIRAHVLHSRGRRLPSARSKGFQTQMFY